MSSIVVIGISHTAWSQYTPQGSSTPLVLLLALILTILGQLMFVRVRHGDTTEELNFIEVALTSWVLLLSPTAALGVALVGVLIGEMLIRRGAWMKIAYNVGMYATATSGMILIYFGLVGSAERLSPRSVAALVLAAGAFAALNLAAVSKLIEVTTGAPRRLVVEEEWRLSLLVAVGSVGIGSVAVALGITPGLRALLPFAFIPILALWYAYLASAEHAAARHRNRWLVILGSTLAKYGQGAGSLDKATEAIRQVVGAPELSIVMAGRTTADGAGPAISAGRAGAEPRSLTRHELPRGWRSGVITDLDLGSESPGALLVGSREPFQPSRLPGRSRGWSLAEADAPMLGALVAAVGSAMRAGTAFDALTEETAKLTSVVDNTSDGIAMIDETNTIRLWSRTLESMTGVSSDTLVGQVADEAPPVVSTLLGASTTAETAGERRTVHVHLVRPDGVELDVSLTTVWVRASITGRSDEEPGWVSILTVQDETRERRVERMKSDFVATVSHELRTPLTPIKGYAPWLAAHGDRVPLAKRTQALRVIADSADHLSRLVDDLLVASQVSEGGRLGVTMGVQDLNEVVSQAVAGFPELAQRITLDLREDPVSIQCDRVRAVQCLSNLLQNAAKYTPEGSPLEVRTEVIGMHARIHVRDHGPGIPAEERERIFERFYRREDPFTMRTGGAGLGLNIARDLAVAMGGGLVVQTPESGRGAEFVLHLATSDAPRVHSGLRASSADSVAGYRPDPRLGSTPPGMPEGSSGDATMNDPRARRLAET